MHNFFEGYKFLGVTEVKHIETIGERSDPTLWKTYTSSVTNLSKDKEYSIFHGIWQKLQL